jgi:plasmid rolling circle replication initiator protein Rep
VIDRVQDKYQNLRPVFLTLTIKNPTHEELNDIIRHMIQSWRRLTEHRTFREQIDGWYRTLEITYNIKDDTFHPHLHVILMVDKRYFSKSNDKYIDIYKWVYLWRMSAKLDYDPVCWIRRVNQKKGNQYKAIAEIVKYCTKDSDYLKSAKYKNSVTRDEVVHTLTKALYRKQLFAYGGKMSEGTKKDAYDKIEHDTSDEIRDDIAHLIERYRWQAGANDYVYRRW